MDNSEVSGLQERARLAVAGGASVSIVTFFFAAGGSSAAKVLAWPCNCLEGLGTPRGRAELSMMLETEFDGWVLNISSISLSDKGESRATLTLDPLGRRAGSSVSVREAVRGEAGGERGFDKIARLLGHVFKQQPAVLKYDFPDCGLRGLGEAAPQGSSMDHQAFVEALEAFACKDSLEKCVPAISMAIPFQHRL